MPHSLLLYSTVSYSYQFFEYAYRTVQYGTRTACMCTRTGGGSSGGSPLGMILIFVSTRINSAGALLG